MSERFKVDKESIGVKLYIDGHLMPLATVVDTERDLIIGVGTNVANTMALANALNFNYKPSDYGYKLVD